MTYLNVGTACEILQANASYGDITAAVFEF